MDSAPLEGDSVKVITILLISILVLDGTMPSTQRAEQENQQKPYVIVVVGAAGTEEYGAQFAKWARLWEEACSKGDAKFAAIGLDTVEGSPAPALPPLLLSQSAGYLSAESTGVRANDRTTLQKTLAGESKQTTAALWLVLIGHGTFDGRTAKFNLRGPDIGR